MSPFGAVGVVVVELVLGLVFELLPPPTQLGTFNSSQETGAPVPPGVGNSGDGLEDSTGAGVEIGGVGGGATATGVGVTRGLGFAEGIGEGDSVTSGIGMTGKAGGVKEGEGEGEGFGDAVNAASALVSAGSFGRSNT